MCCVKKTLAIGEKEPHNHLKLQFPPFLRGLCGFVFPRAALTPVPGWRAKYKSHDKESVAFFCITEDSLRGKNAAFTILTICFF